MNSTITSQALAMVTALGGPALTAPRALLVSLDEDGNLQHQAVGMGQSVVRLETELFDHLNSKPFSDEWIAMLRDYCNGRLAAVAEARSTGGFVTAPEVGVWHINHVPAFQQLTVGGAK